MSTLNDLIRERNELEDQLKKTAKQLAQATVCLRLFVSDVDAAGGVPMLEEDPEEGGWPDLIPTYNKALRFVQTQPAYNGEYGDLDA